MKAATAAIILASMLSFGIFATLAGGMVRGEKGQGSVHQHMVNDNHDW